MFEILPVSIQLYIGALTFFLGSFLGSGLNCLAWRMVRQQKWSHGRSQCPQCHHTLGILDLIPVFSWLLLRGRCRHCGAKISPRYVITEALLGLGFVSVLLRFGLTADCLSALVLISCLFALSLVDLEIQIIPDRFLAIPAAVRLIQLAFEGNLLSGLLPGLIFGGGLLILSLIMDKILKKDSMGGGDIKLMAVLGLFFTVPECLLLLVIACVVGIFMAAILMKIDSETAFPFGPALSIAAWLTLLFGSAITGWYLSLF